jgi:hypothetical protein
MSISTLIPEHIQVRIIIQKESGCMLWIGGLYPKGYAKTTVKMGQNPVSVHKLMYERFIKKVDSGKELDHLCRVRNCVNPTHLEEVTSAENTRRGLLTLLSITQVHEINKLYRTGNYTQQELASRFKVDQTTISDILNGRSWADIRKQYGGFLASNKTKFETIVKIVSLRKKGFQFKQIANKLGVSASSACNLYNKYKDKV